MPEIAVWKEKTKAGEEIKGDPIRKRVILDEIKGIEQTVDGLKIPFVISTGSVDRDKDTINPDGWKLDNFKKNPVLLWAHDGYSPPIGKSTKIWLHDGKLKSEALFTPKDLNPFGHMIGEMYAKGFMRAVSVGFDSDKWEWSKADGREWGIDFKSQELLEYSAVPVPANPEALMSAKSSGLDISPLIEWAENILDGHGLWIPKEKAEKIWENFSPHKTYSFSVKGVDPGDISTMTAPESEAWEKPTLGDFTNESWTELSDAEKSRIAKHYAYAEEMPPSSFGALKFPHHNPSNGEVVWSAVANAAARLNQSNLSAEDKTKAQNHLARHYRAFERTPPWEEPKNLSLFERITKEKENRRMDL